jgi:DNA-binding CsgD family transcriptional regulator
MTLSSIDAQWLDFAADLMSTPLTELPDERIAHQLQDTFELVGAAYHVRSPGRVAVQNLWPRGEQFRGYRAEIEHWAVHCAPVGHPVLRYYLATWEGVPMQACEVPDRFADRRVQGAWLDVSGSWDVPAQLALPLHMSTTSSRCFVMGRPHRFGPGEVQLAGRLHRLLTGLDRQVQTLRRFRSGMVGAAWERVESVRLTTRELTVLTLLADGLTAAAAARRLLLAERTVRKHLERVYAKLGVSDRVSAVLRAQRLGLLDAPGPAGYQAAANGGRSSKAAE